MQSPAQIGKPGGIGRRGGKAAADFGGEAQEVVPVAGNREDTADLLLPEPRVSSVA